MQRIWSCCWQKDFFYFISLYTFPSETKDEFDNFVKIFGVNSGHIANEKQFLFVVLGGFNTRSKSGYKNDIANAEGSRIKRNSNNKWFNVAFE